MIRRARADAGMTQAELANRAGLGQSAIARLERGGANPTVATLDNVIAATGHRLILAAEPRRASFDEGQLLERLAMTPAQRVRADEILRRLVQRGVDFVVVGGIAAELHGSARTTSDLAITFATDDANLAALGDVLTALGVRLEEVDEQVPFVPDAETLRRVERLALVTSLGGLDLRSCPPGAPPYEELRRDADRYDLGGFNVSVASIDDLIAMLQAAMPTKELLDIEELEAIKRLRQRR